MFPNFLYSVEQYIMRKQLAVQPEIEIVAIMNCKSTVNPIIMASTQPDEHAKPDTRRGHMQQKYICYKKLTIYI